MAKAAEQKTFHGHLHVDLPHALERAPVERVLVDQFAGAGGFHAAAAELRAVRLQQPDLLLAQRDRGLARAGLQAQKPLEACLEVMAQPDPAHLARRHAQARQAKFVGHPRRAPGRAVEAGRRGSAPRPPATPGSGAVGAACGAGHPSFECPAPGSILSGHAVRPEGRTPSLARAQRAERAGDALPGPRVSAAPSISRGLRLACRMELSQRAGGVIR